MSRTKIYRYLDSDSIAAHNRDRFNPDREPKAQGSSNLEALTETIVAELKLIWALPATQGPGMANYIINGVRERNVRYYLRTSVEGLRASELAKEEGLSTRSVQRAVKAGRQLLIESRARLAAITRPTTNPHFSE